MIALTQLPTAFPDYNIETLPIWLIPEGFRDTSWKNDACPSFWNPESNLVIWCDYPRPQDRENPEASRFTLQTAGDDPQTIVASDDWQDIEDALEAWAIASRYVARLGLGFHPDTRGEAYVDSTGKPTFTPDEAREYDAAMERLCALSSEPYAIALTALEKVAP